MGSLVVCAACSRHVRRNETSCPFCEAAISFAVASTPERALPTTRVGRAALFAFAAASVAAVGCGGTVDGTSRTSDQAGGTTSNGGITSTGGATGSGGTINLGGTTSAGGEVGTGGDLPIPFYGAAFPPEDAGRPRDGGARSDAGYPFQGEPLYGAPPAPPAGHDGGFAFYARRDDDELALVPDDEDDPIG